MSITVVRKKHPWIKDDVEFYEHQVDGCRDLIKRKSFLLADDMGLGKTLEALTVFASDVALGWSSKCLVICPASLKGNWADEIEKFTNFPYVIVNGTSDERMKQLLEFMGIEGPKILVVNYEQVIAHQETLDSFMFDVAMFDEAQYLQNPEAKRTLACLDVYSRRSFMLSGTPMLNHVPNLWAILHRIGAYPGGYYAFINRYAVFGGYKGKQVVGVKNEAELTERLQNVMLRRLKRDVLDLPDVQMIERRVDLLPEQQMLYDQVKDELKLIRWDMDKPDDIENALTKFLRLKEICGTTFKFTNEDHSSKLDLAISDDKELLENNHKLVVFTQFLDVQSCYIKRMNKSLDDVPIWTINGGVKPELRTGIVKEWSQTITPGVLLCTHKTAGVGLNMTASRHMSFLDKMFTPGVNQQAIDRLHRIGANKTQSIQVRDYIARNTIENRINQILKTKMKVSESIVESDADWKRKLVEKILEEEGWAV